MTVRCEDERWDGWTPSRLRACVDRLCGGDPILVLANREPFRHEWTPGGGVAIRRSAGGLVTALEPILEASGGTWIAHGAGGADQASVDATGGVRVPPDRPTYRLRRVWLDADDERGYYFGFANEGLWPLCHRVHVRPVFRTADFATYARVNDRFAAAACEEAAGPAPVVLVQDYHFALAPAMIRARAPGSTIASFWHIPWPSAGEFAICPWGTELVRGLLGSDIVGFHTTADCEQFLDAAEAVRGAEVDRTNDVVCCDGRETIVRAYPISIGWPYAVGRRTAPVDACRAAVRSRFHLDPEVPLVVGIDRLDYTKGLPEKVAAVEGVLERYPEFRGRLTLLQVAEPSRTCLPAYRDLRARLVDAIDDVNRRFGCGDYRPIILLEQHHDPSAVCELLRSADVCYVGSVHDGMNLVAKEFAAARDDERGVLVLSAFTGAARQLTTALLVNPYATDESAHTLARALHMAPSEQRGRMVAMRGVVSTFNSYWWAGQMLRDAARCRFTAGRLTRRPMPTIGPVRSFHPAAPESDRPAQMLARLR